MNQQFMNADEDVQWLKDTALKGIPGIPGFRSFLLFGNEDSPDQVELFASRDPSIFDKFFRITFDHSAPIYCVGEEVTP